MDVPDRLDEFDCPKDEFEQRDGKADTADDKLNCRRPEFLHTARVVLEGKEKKQTTDDEKNCACHKKDQSRILAVVIRSDTVMGILM